MSHEIMELDSPVYGGNKAAWHGLGTVVQGQPNASTAIKLAKLDWNVNLEPLYTRGSGENLIGVPDYFAVHRTDLKADDSRRCLGVVGSKYVPIQNVEAFTFADTLVGEGGAKFESVGSLRNGRIVWLLAQLPDKLTVKDDTINKYLLLKTTHDGTGALQAMLTPVRVVCWNTLSAAIRGAQTVVSVRHTINAAARVAEARKILGLANDYFGKLGDEFTKLATIPVSKKDAEKMLAALVPDPTSPTTKATRARGTRDAIMALFAGAQKGATQDAARGTAYGLYNAAAEYADHHRTVRVATNRGETGRGEARFEAAMWGSGAAFKQRAFDIVSDFAGSYN